MKEIIAAFMFFTRLPLWRVCKIPPESFKRIVAYWPLTGLLTGGVMTIIYLLAIHLHFHLILAVLMAFISRLLLTGALHEDGLADFFDGFGGGRTRAQVLSIMKDSHTGSYGVLGLILYTLLWVGSVFTLIQPFTDNVYIIFFTCDIWSKWCASQIINVLPYARKEEESKIKQTYERMSSGEFITGLIFGILPFAYLIIHYLAAAHICSGDTSTMSTSVSLATTGAIKTNAFPIMAAGAIVPVITMLILTGYMKRRIQGYTGDCCGAMFLLCELSYLLILNCLWKFF